MSKTEILKFRVTPEEKEIITSRHYPHTDLSVSICVTEPWKKKSP